MFEPYGIQCVTCSAKLKVRDPALVGEIMQCPKCRSMVLVEPPLQDSGGEPAAADQGQDNTKAAAGLVSAVTLDGGAPAAGVSEPLVTPPTDSTTTTTVPAPAPLDAGGITAPIDVASVPTMPVAPISPVQNSVMLGTAASVGVMFAVGVWMFVKSQSTVESRPAAVVTTAPQNPSPSPEPAVNVDEEAERTPAANDPPRSDAPILSQDRPEERPNKENQADPDTTSNEAGDRADRSTKPSRPAAAETKDDSGAADRGEPSAGDHPADEPFLIKTSDEPPGESPLREPEDLEPDMTPSVAREHPIPVPNPDVAARLDLPLNDVSFIDSPLKNVLVLFTEMTAVPVRADRVALSRVGLTPSSAVRIQRKAATVRQLLDALLHPRGLTYIPTGDHVVITTAGADSAPLHSVRYRIDDLAASPAAMKTLADLVRHMIAPNGWSEEGGRGTLTIDGDVLVVSQTPETHFNMLVFCEKMRIARKLPTRSRVAKADPERFVLDSRSHQAVEMLKRPVSCGADGRMPLAHYLRQLEYRAGITVSLDELGIMRAGVLPSAGVTVDSAEKPLVEILTSALETMGLTWRAADASTIEVTSPLVVEQSPEVEFYKLDTIDEAMADPPAFLQRLRSDVVPGRWIDDGGAGEIRYDRDSRCLIVRQPQPVQRQVEQWLQSRS